jgi:hypothetical protein
LSAEDRILSYLRSGDCFVISRSPVRSRRVAPRINRLQINSSGITPATQQNGEDEWVHFPGLAKFLRKTSMSSLRTPSSRPCGLS